MSWELSLILVSLAVLSLTAFGTIAGWRRRTIRQTTSVAAPKQALDNFGEKLASATCLYVATTFSDDHLNRITAHGLAFRGKAQISVFSEGVLITRVGERPVAIPRAELSGVVHSTAVIDKGVEAGGLLGVQFGDNLVTHLRFTNPQDSSLIEAKIKELIGKEAKQ
jgi:hypothetical protein